MGGCQSGGPKSSDDEQGNDRHTQIMVEKWNSKDFEVHVTDPNLQDAQDHKKMTKTCVPLCKMILYYREKTLKDNKEHIEI